MRTQLFASSGPSTFQTPFHVLDPPVHLLCAPSPVSTVPPVICPVSPFIGSPSLSALWISWLYLPAVFPMSPPLDTHPVCPVGPSPSSVTHSLINVEPISRICAGIADRHGQIETEERGMQRQGEPHKHGGCEAWGSTVGVLFVVMRTQASKNTPQRV